MDIEANIAAKFSFMPDDQQANQFADPGAIIGSHGYIEKGLSS